MLLVQDSIIPYRKFSLAYFISSSRKSGWAMAAIASARSRRLFPESAAMPYSVATYWIIVRGAEIVLPEGIAATMLLLRSPSLVMREELMQMKPLPPFER